MPAQSHRIKQTFAIIIAVLFVTGLFYSPIGMWTGPILGLWFVGTQKIRTGFFWLFAFSFIPLLIKEFAELFHSPASQIPSILLWTTVAVLIEIIPFVFQRLISPRLKGLLSTLPYPLAAALIQPLVLFTLPISGLAFMTHQSGDAFTIFHLFKFFGPSPLILTIVLFIFITSWLSVGVLWFWNHSSDLAKHRGIIFTFCAILLLFITLNFLPTAFYEWFAGHVRLNLIYAFEACTIFLTLYAIFRPAYRTPSWANNQDAIALLQSPTTQTPLHFLREGNQENLISSTGERFPILNGIPQFVSAESLSGANKKYNHLYQTIGGFYDDTQRVVAALAGISVDDHFLAYLGNLELKPGDKVLETSVGTGLNWKYLPASVELHGLDLSPEMLLNCQSNLRRWNLTADLVLGNAEELPYADNSFDCVFHVGGINFFSDRAKAITEMIRVAKPGTLILIADETEEHVKTVYENAPWSGRFFKKRKEPVLPPTDLIPPTMQEITLDTSLMNGHFYVLTFRKPL